MVNKILDHITAVAFLTVLLLLALLCFCAPGHAYTTYPPHFHRDFPHSVVVWWVVFEIYRRVR